MALMSQRSAELVGVVGCASSETMTVVGASDTRASSAARPDESGPTKFVGANSIRARPFHAKGRRPRRPVNTPWRNARPLHRAHFPVILLGALVEGNANIHRHVFRRQSRDRLHDRSH